MHVLSLFPRSGFDQSVTTPVLFGVLVSWFFTESFGWVFAGLVVPGYLASVFLLEPAAGVIDVAEALVTYGVSRVIGEHLPRLGIMSRAFGRERFFLVVVVSILVRLVVEAWLLPRALPHVTWAFSLGLVVVPLAANACWKTGLGSGIVQNGIPALVVYLLLRFVFVPYTNLSLAGFELATENVAASFLASPKAYIILVTGALLAAAANIRYGWDFNGIAVPALLGLSLLAPVKFFATFAETVLLYATVTALVRFTPLRRAQLEGPRRVVLFFTVDYLLRFGVAWIMGRSLPGGDVVAFMGFGYLVPTLLAVKISQRESTPLVLLPTATVSVLAFVLGSFVGFGALVVDRSASAAEPAPQGAPGLRTIPEGPTRATDAALWSSQLALDDAPEPEQALPSPRRLVEAASQENHEFVRAASMTAHALDRQCVLLRERFEGLGRRRGLPVILARAPLPERPLVAFVPTPLAAPSIAAAAGHMLESGDVDAVVIAGVEEPTKSLLELETTAHATARTLAGRGELLVLRQASDARLTASIEAGGRAPERMMRAAVVFTKGSLRRVDGEPTLALDPREIARILAPVEAPVDLETATSMARLLDESRAATDPGTLEDLVALRRLVLSPLLAHDASEADRALAPLAARMLGYRVTAPSPFGGRGLGVAMLPVERNRPLALFARVSGVETTLVEAPIGAHRGVRDLALRLGVGLRADAIVVGEAFDASMRGGAARAAHSSATDASNATVVFVKEDPLATGATLAAWMDDGTSLGKVKSSLDALGLTTTVSPPDLATRDLATRTLLRPAPVVALTCGPLALVTASLDDARHQSELLEGMPFRDDSVSSVAKALAAQLDATTPAAGLEDLAETVHRAATDRSVVATRRLLAVLGRGAAKASLVRAKEGSFLVVASRSGPDRSIVVASLAPDAKAWRTERRSVPGSCLAFPILGGACGWSEP